MLHCLVLFLFVSAVICEGQQRPNFVVILTDDQDVVLDGMVPLKNVKKFIADEGITFSNAGCHQETYTAEQMRRTLEAVHRGEQVLFASKNTVHLELPTVPPQAGRPVSTAQIMRPATHACGTIIVPLYGNASPYTTSPICCPSRASFLTGLYVHNHQTFNNSLSGGCYSEHWKQNHESNTFANILKSEGYNTFYAGKYLNEYGVKSAGGWEQVPPGWAEWHGLVGNSVYYNYTISNNGVPTHSTNLYLTDVIRDVSISYIENQTDNQPFLMVLAPPAPHQPFTPAARHKGTYRNITAVKHPNFNIEAKNKHWLMSMPPTPLPESMIEELNEVYRSRWEALLAVDEMVADVIGALETSSLLDNTYIIYTSDNGYHIGQFSQVYDKRQPYETDIKVPLLIRGPGLSKGIRDNQPVLNIDIAPTIATLAGSNTPRVMDGHVIELSQLYGDEPMVERNMLIEYYGEGTDRTVDAKCPWRYDSENLSECYPKYDCKCQDSRNNTYGCLRHLAERINFKYCLFVDNQNFQEIYDLAEDPYEMNNLIDEILPAVKYWYRLTLAQMLVCKGSHNCEHPLDEILL